MDDVVKSIKAHLYDRVVSPLFGAFLISWCIWNYRVIFVLLSSEIIQYKFNYIDEYYSSFFYYGSFSVSKLLLIGIAAPVFSAFLYIYAYPFLALPVYKFSLSRQKRLNEVKNEIEGNTLLTLDKSRRIIQDAKKMQIEYNKQMEIAEEEIESLRKIISDQMVEIDKLRTASPVEKLPPNDEVVSADHSSGKVVGEAADILSSPELAELEKFIVDVLFQKKVGEEFLFSSLIPVETWAHFTDEKRHSLEQSFRAGVESRRYVNVKLSEKQIDNSVVRYTILDFQSCKGADSIIIYILEKIASNKYKTVQLNDLKSWREWNFHLLSNGLNYLIEKGFVENVIHSGRPAYRIKKEGELYLAGSR